MAHIKKIEELAHYINKHRHSKPPRILAAGDLYYRSHILSWTVQGHKLRTCLGWSKNWFRNFVSIGSNRTLWRNRKNAPKSFLALYELSRSREAHLQALFDRKLVTPETSGTQARILIADQERSRPVDQNSPRIPRTLRECPDYLSLGRTSLTRTEKRSLERTAVEIERLLKGTIDDFLEASAKCDRFAQWHRSDVPQLLKKLRMSNSKFCKIARCVRIEMYSAGRTRNLPRPLDPLYRISQIKLTDLREALQHEIFSRHTTAPQVPKILADFKAKKIRPKS